VIDEKLINQWNKLKKEKQKTTESDSSLILTLSESPPSLSKEVTRERAFSYLSDKNLKRLVDTYFKPEKHQAIAQLVDITEIRENMYNLSIPLYIHNTKNGDNQTLESTIEA
jgi:type I restriction-modification system DNA methylase subunit